MKEIAADLDVSEQTLRNWVFAAQVDAGERDDVTTDEREELRVLRSKVRVLEQEREILKKPRPGSPRRPARPVAVFEFVEANRAVHQIAVMCRVLGVSTRGPAEWDG
jgi:hypothetical protein